MSVNAHAFVLNRFSCVQLFATLWTLWSPPGSSVHGTLQAKVLEWGAIAFSLTMFKIPYLKSLGFPGGSDGKESACSVGDLGLIPGLKDPLEERMATHSSILGLPWWLRQ